MPADSRGGRVGRSPHLGHVRWHPPGPGRWGGRGSDLRRRRRLRHVRSGPGPALLLPRTGRGDAGPVLPLRIRRSVLEVARHQRGVRLRLLRRGYQGGVLEVRPEPGRHGAAQGAHRVRRAPGRAPWRRRRRGLRRRRLRRRRRGTGGIGGNRGVPGRGPARARQWRGTEVGEASGGRHRRQRAAGSRRDRGRAAASRPPPPRPSWEAVAAAAASLW